MLKIKNLSKKYGSTQALTDVSFDVEKGEIIGLFGENGAGKTTLMKSILRFLKFDGSIELDGETISRKNIERFSFATSEHSFFGNLNAKEHRDFYFSYFETFREDRFNMLMDFFELPRNKAIRSFSYGQKNQFEVIMALSQGANFILMDEPFAGNDVFNREDFYKVLLGILEPHETIILSTHLIDEVSNFIDRVLLLNKGRLVSDIPTDKIEAEGKTLLGHIKEISNYRSDRVSEMIGNMNLK